MKKRGRKRPPDAEFVIEQVMRRFGPKKEALGAKKAAYELGVSVASFYNYVNGKTVPDIQVLRTAKRVWDINWPKLMDPSEILPHTKARSPEQYVLSFLHRLDKEDIEIIAVKPKGATALQVTLKIRFTAAS